MIQEAMAKGEFDNLSNAGKPLKERPVNPYVDTVTHRINEVCGFTHASIKLYAGFESTSCYSIFLFILFNLILDL